MSNNKYISPHLIKLYNSTSLSKDILNIIQVYLLPDINNIKLIKKRYNTHLISETSYISFICDKFSCNNRKYKKFKEGTWIFN
jgi:hypothetical protein